MKKLDFAYPVFSYPTKISL